MNPSTILACTLLPAVLATSKGATTAYLPSSYRGTFDSPFTLGIREGAITVENFEDDRYDTSKINMIGGEIRHGTGVDEDSTGLDYDGRGQTFYRPGNSAAGRFRIRFLPSPEGLYPTHVGMAVLGFFRSPIISSATIYAYGPGGEEVILGGIVRPLPVYINYPGAWTSLGDEFVGFYSSDGIESLSFDGVNFDHLQWGRMAVPEPGACWLGMAAVFPWLQRRRRRMGRTE